MSHLSCPIPSHPVPFCPIPSCPVWANWWLLVLGWDNWSTYSINVYKHIWHLREDVPLVPSHPILLHSVPSHPILYGPIGGYWCWAGTIGPHGPSMYTSIYMASQARCPTCPVLSHPIPYHPIPSYLSNCLRYRLDPGLVGKVFESTFQILKNGISMAASLATRCKTPWQPDANG